MAILRKSEIRSVTDKINEIERHTDAELVTVLSKQSDSYSYIPLLWASAVALTTPLIALLLPFWLETLDIFLLQLGVFVGAALLFRLPGLSIRVIPKSVRYWRASNMARRQFLENNLHHTKNEMGVLLFVSETERYVEIIADRGINQLVEKGKWQEIIDEFVTDLRHGNNYSGLVNCINSCGELLKTLVPATEEKNELPNHLVVLGEKSQDK